MIAAWGLRIVGTKYLPPRFPTLETLNVASSKSALVKPPLSTLFLNSMSSLLIASTLFSYTFLIAGTVKPSAESIAIE